MFIWVRDERERERGREGERGGGREGMREGERAGGEREGDRMSERVTPLDSHPAPSARLSRPQLTGWQRNGRLYRCCY